MPPAGDPQRGGLLRRSTATHRTCAQADDGGPRRRRYLDVDAVVAAAVLARAPRRSTRLRLPVRARGVRRGGDRRPGCVRRPAGRGDGGDGPQGRRARDRRRGRGPGRAVVPTPTRGWPQPSWTTRCWSRLRRAAAARACGSSGRPDELADAVAAAQREARSAFGDDTHAVREVRRARPAHRGAGHGRRPRQRRAPVRARLLGPAPPPEGARGGAGADDHATRSASSVTASAVALARAGRLRQRRHRRVPARRRRRRGVLPRDEHPAPGRAPGHRGWSPASTWSTCSSASRPGEPLPFAQDDVRHRARDRGAGLRRGPVRRVPAAGRRRRRWCAGRPRLRVDAALESGQGVSTAYDPMLGKVIAHGPTGGGPPRAGRGAGRDRRSSGSPPTSASCATWPTATRSATPTIDTAWLDRTDGRGARPRRRPRMLAAWTQAVLAAITDERAIRSRPTAGGWAPSRRPGHRRARRDRSWSTVPAGRRSTRPRGRPSLAASTTSCALIVDGASAPRGRQRAAARGRGGAPRPAVRVRPARRVRSDHDRRAGDGTLVVADAGHRPRRPGRRGRRRSRRARCWA